MYKMILYRPAKGAIPSAWFIHVSQQGNWHTWLCVTNLGTFQAEEIKVNGSYIAGGNPATKTDLRRLVRYLFTKHFE